MISSDKFYFVLEKIENMVTDPNLRSIMENEQLFSLCMIEKKILPHLCKISAGAPGLTNFVNHKS